MEEKMIKKIRIIGFMFVIFASYFSVSCKFDKEETEKELESKISLTVSLPNDDGETVILTNDKAPIKLTISSTDTITKAVYKKRQNGSVPNANNLITDEDSTDIKVDSETLIFYVFENGLYDIAVQNSKGICEYTSVEIKTINKVPFSEVENLSGYCDGEYVYLSWKNPVSESKYDSPLKNVKVFYIYNDDKYDSANGEFLLSIREENLSIKIANGKKETDYVSITVQTIDELNNVSKGSQIQVWCYRHINISTTSIDVEQKIKEMTESGSVEVFGYCNLSSIKNALEYLMQNKPDVKVELDLSKTTGITCIDNYAFKDCINIANIIIPDTVTTIGYEAFKNCSGLKKMDIPDSVTAMNRYAFSGCSELEHINMSENITVIEYELFSGCTKLKKIIIPNNVTKIEDYAFQGCENLTSVSINACVLEKGVKNVFENYINISELIIQQGVEEIPDLAFDSWSNLLSVEIQDSVTHIGYRAFYRCTNLISLTIPNSVMSIGEKAFYRCASLTSLTIPSSVKSIGERAFYGCENLTDLTIPNSVTSIGRSAFGECYCNVYYTGTIEEWCSISWDGDPFFSSYDLYLNNKKVTKVVLTNSITNIGDYAFSHCKSLTSVTIPSSITNISRGAFVYCSSLTTVTIPNSITNIGDSAFYGCTSLTSLMIPRSVTFIGSKALSNFQHLIFEDTTSVWYYTSSTYLRGESYGPMSVTDTIENARFFYNHDGCVFYNENFHFE